jgi:hypothetical protein
MLLLGYFGENYLSPKKSRMELRPYTYLFMKNIKFLLTLSLSSLCFIHSSNAEVLAGWHTWSNLDDGSANAVKISDTSPDTLATGITAIAGVTVNSSFLNVGGGQQLSTQDSTITWGGTWPGEDILTNSSVQIRPANNSQRSLDFQITNNGTTDLELAAFMFHYRKGEATNPNTTAISVTHLSGQSDLNVASGAIAGTAVAAANYQWYVASIDLTTLSDNVIGVGEDAAFSLSLPALGSFVGWQIDNVAFDGAFVPEPGTCALIAGLLALTFVMVRRK